MAQTGNVYLAFVGKDQVSKTIKGINKNLGRLGTGARKVGAGLAKMGTLAAAGVTALAGGLAYATKQAIGEEAQLKKLDAALNANAKGYKGNLDAVEEMIAKRQDLAYSDGELRDSMIALLPYTKSADKAFEAQSVAMDLARLKGIDLTAASEQIGKALGGNTKVLKSLGIELPKTASKAEILAAIQQKAAGQAEAYANSTEGQFVQLKNAVDNTVEDLGSAFLPIALELAGVLRKDILPAFQSALPGIIDFGKGLISGIVNVVQNYVIPIWNRLQPAIARVADFFTTTLVPAFATAGNFIVQNVIPKIAGLIETFIGPGGIVESVAKVVGPIIADLLPVFGKIIEVASNIIGKVGELVGILWGDGNGPLALAVKGIGAAFGVLGTILGAIGDVISFVLDLVIGLAKAIADSPIGQILGGIGGFISDALDGRAKGGPVKRGTPYIVGEKGPELFVPGAMGSIVPNNRLSSVTQGGGAGGGNGISAEQLRYALSGLVVVMDGDRVGSLIDTRLAKTVRTASTTSRFSGAR